MQRSHPVKERALEAAARRLAALDRGRELERVAGVFAEQVIRPTGLIDPVCIIRPAEKQDDGSLAYFATVDAEALGTVAAKPVASKACNADRT